MTRLEAINYILISIGEYVINTEDEMTPEAEDINNVLNMITRIVCSDKEPFNIYPVKLQVNKDGEIEVPKSSILSVDIRDDIDYIRVRNNKLYNINTKSYTFNNDIECYCKLLIDFDDLEEEVQQYIVSKTNLKKIQTEIGNQDLVKAAMNEMNEAMKEYISYNLNITNINFINNPYNLQFKRYYEWI